jgi:hypothetical protein
LAFNHHRNKRLIKTYPSTSLCQTYCMKLLFSLSLAHVRLHAAFRLACEDNDYEGRQFHTFGLPHSGSSISQMRSTAILRCEGLHLCYLRTLSTGYQNAASAAPPLAHYLISKNPSYQTSTANLQQLQFIPSSHHEPLKLHLMEKCFPRIALSTYLEQHLFTSSQCEYQLPGIYIAHHV